MSLNATILVTGGAGFIGSALVRHLVLEARARVVTVDKLGYAGSLLNLREVADNPLHSFVQADICDGPALTRVFQEHDPGAVMHLAAESHVDRSIDRPADFIQSNLVGTYQVMDCALAHFRGMDAARRDGFRVLHVSTDEVYGSLAMDAPAFREGDPYRPNSPYAASKAGADHLAQAWAATFGLPVVVSNCTNNYGPYQYPEKLIPVVVVRALRGEAIPVYGRGENVRDWLHFEDHVQALHLITRHGRPGERYNVGGECEVANLDLVRRICTIMDEVRPRPEGAPYHDLIEFVEDRPGHDLRYAMSADKLHAELGWSPRHTFEDGLRATVMWYLDNQDWCEQVTAGAYTGQRRGLAR